MFHRNEGKCYQILDDRKMANRQAQELKWKTSLCMKYHGHIQNILDILKFRISLEFLEKM